MKNRILSLILSLAIFTLMLPEVVSTANSFGVSDGFTYELTSEFRNDGVLEAVIWGYTGSEERVVIPERVGGIIVRAVRTLRMVGTGVTGDAAYGAAINENVKTVVIPPVVKYLDGKMKAGNIENIVFAPRESYYRNLEIKYNAGELSNWNVSLNYSDGAKSAEEKTVAESLSTSVFAGCKSSKVYYKTGDFTYSISNNNNNATVVAYDEKESRIEVPKEIIDTSKKTLPVVGIESVTYDLSYEEGAGYVRTETVIIPNGTLSLSGSARSGKVNNFVFRPRTNDIAFNTALDFNGSNIYLHYINDEEKAMAETSKLKVWWFDEDGIKVYAKVHSCIRNKPCTEAGKYICSTDCEVCAGIEFGDAPVEEHDITYSLDNNSNNAKIIAKCKKEYCKTEVSHLTLKAPGELTGGSYIVVWDGAPKTATFDNLEAFNTATGKNITVNDISYYKKNEGNGTQIALKDPINEGKYVAKFTVEGVTAEVSFEITKIVLPSTGGIGTGLFTAVGVILMGVAGVLFLILKKKK